MLDFMGEIFSLLGTIDAVWKYLGSVPNPIRSRGVLGNATSDITLFCSPISKVSSTGVTGKIRLQPDSGRIRF
jgi:hypothetical protein